MYRTKAKSIKALAANSLVENLQQYFVHQLNEQVCSDQEGYSFDTVEWFRDQGKHGGGVRYVANSEQIFNRASVNVSHIHYDDDPSKGLGSATALSTIIHPQNPHAASLHMHISWTEMKGGKGYWRMMADLNPAIENNAGTKQFRRNLKEVAPELFQFAAAQGDRYFNIPVLKRQRGVCHFYLEEYTSRDAQADFNLAVSLGKTVIDTYIELFLLAVEEHPNPSEADYQKQLAYHTLYLFQVLTLDRGTTSGLLVHDQNDVGIMGSLPARIDRGLLTLWVEKLMQPQNKLLLALLKVLPEESPCTINEETKLEFAKVIRQHYQQYPKALAMQAQGNVVPPTVDNHK